MRFSVGDRVTVRTDLRPDEYYGGLYFNPAMAEYVGKTYTIVGFDAYHAGQYYLDTGSDYKWVFNDNMLISAPLLCKRVMLKKSLGNLQKGEVLTLMPRKCMYKNKQGDILVSPEVVASQSKIFEEIDHV